MGIQVYIGNEIYLGESTCPEILRFRNILEIMKIISFGEGGKSLKGRIRGLEESRPIALVVVWMGVEMMGLSNKEKRELMNMDKSGDCREEEVRFREERVWGNKL